MRPFHYFLAFVSMLMFGSVQAKSINLNFYNTQGAAAENQIRSWEVAGQVAVLGKHWNQIGFDNGSISGVAAQKNIALKDDGGNQSAALFASTLNSAYVGFSGASAGSGSVGSKALMSSYLSFNPNDNGSFEISELSNDFCAPSYTVYVYFDSDSTTRTHALTLTPSGGSAQVRVGEDSGAYAGEFVQANGAGSYANVAVFKDLTVPGFTLAMDASVGRGAVNGIQIVSKNHQSKMKIACVGDFITFGATIPVREKLSYPAQLGYLVGDDYEVRNFGVNGSTLLENGDIPYTGTTAYQRSRDFMPDIVVIMLGTNDSKPKNWQHKAQFVQDGKNLIAAYRSLASKPRVILCKPVVVTSDNGEITESITHGEVSPMLAQVAYETNTELLDLHAILLDQKNWLPDTIHPNPFGAERIARAVQQYLAVERDAEFAPKIDLQGTPSSFHGFEMIRFNHQGAECYLVKPQAVAQGAPWIWRARFWDHEPQFNVAMLALGYHVVYCDVADLYGAPSAVKRWDGFYALMQKYGLHPKAVLEAMSRGGLIIHNWAVANPAKVAGLIGDNPVMDFKSWPAGFGTSAGSPNDWIQYKQAYGLQSDEEASAYGSNPVDTVGQLVAQEIPILYLVGDADQIVPGAENAILATDRSEGHVQLLVKPGMGHHPHSLPNPAPIVDFGLKCYGLYQNPAAQAAPSAEFRGASAGWGGGIWWDQHENISQIAADHQDLELVFLGDSITQSWTGPHERLSDANASRSFDRYFGKRWKSASFGVSGDRTENLIYRVKHGNFDGLAPKAVVLMVGVNNIVSGGNDAAQVADGIETITQELLAKMPATRVILLGPFPSGKLAEDPRRRTIAAVQQLIAPLGQHPRVVHLDLASAFTNTDGTLKTELYNGDHLHLNASGYETWAQALMPTLQSQMVPSKGTMNVFLLGGQSNMQGTARSSKLPPELLTMPEIKLFAAGTGVAPGIAKRWVDLQPANGSTFGLEIGFGKRLIDLCPGQNLAFIKYADSGTSLELGWKPGSGPSDRGSWGPQFTGFVQTVSDGLAALEADGWQPVIHGMIWQQGEQDAKNGLNVAESTNSANDYAANLAALIARIREQFGTHASPDDIRFVSGQVLPYAPAGGDVEARFPGRDLVRQAILDSAEDSGAPFSVANAGAVPTNSTEHPTHAQMGDGYRPGDEVHLNHTALLALGNAMAYEIMNLKPQSYLNWASEHQLGGGPADDDDHDGVSNLIEFYLGTDPTDPNSAGQASSAIETIDGERHLTLTFSRNLNAFGLKAAVQVSTDLEHWNQSASPIVVESLEHEGHLMPVKYRAPWSISDASHPRVFMRLKVTL